MRKADADQQLFAAAQRLGGIGTWEWLPETERVIWSEQTFDVFGLDPESSTPSIGLLVALTHPDDRERLSREIASIHLVEPDHTFDYRIIDRSGAVRHLRSTLVFREMSGDRLVRAGGCVLDRTATHLADREIAAYTAVTEAIDSWDFDNHGPETMLERIAAALECKFATMWVPADRTLTPRASWAAASVGERDLLLLRHRIEFEPPDEVVLSAYREREPKSAPARRDPGQFAIGRFAFPALAGQEVLAVCELLSREPVRLAERLTRTLVAISHELGSFLSRNRAELHASGLTPREIEILRLASNGLSGPQISDQLEISRSTVKTHFDHIYAKLDATDRAAAVAKALRMGLFD